MKTALLIIDVQQSLVDEGVWEADRVIARLNQLMAAARSQHLPVILVRDTRVEPDGSFHRTLDRDAHDPVIEKRFCDAFMETHLDALLRSKNISRLVVGGMQSDFCVDTTCRQGAALGYDVVLVADAHSTLDHEHLKAEQIVAHHNRILRAFDTARGRVRVSAAATVTFR